MWFRVWIRSSEWVSIQDITGWRRLNLFFRPQVRRNESLLGGQKDTKKDAEKLGSGPGDVAPRKSMLLDVRFPRNMT